MTVYIKGSPINLNQNDYVAEGGEGKVYAHGDIGYKVYHDPAKMLPLGKIRELQAIQNPNVIRPLDVLTDKKGNPVGYSMRFIRNSWSLSQLFPRSFRDRNQITHTMIHKMVKDLYDLFVDIHKAGILIVDANEMNFLLTNDFQIILAIDADSYQTPHYPATVIMPSIRDWSVHGLNWTEGSDWFSFACVSFQMFTAIHPFKGKHPKADNRLEERMKAGISVLDKDVMVPPVAYDFSVIPKEMMDWYKRVFVHGERSQPPCSGSVFSNGISAKPVQTKGSGLLTVKELYSYDSDIRRFWEKDSKLVVVTENSTWVDRRQVGPSYSKIYGCAFTSRDVPVLAINENGVLTLYDLDNQVKIPFGFNADEITSYGGRLDISSGNHVYEVVLTEASNKIFPSTKSVANILPQSSRLFQGIIMQSMLGTAFVSLLEGSGTNYQINLKELDKSRVVDAKYDNHVLMVIKEQGTLYDRLVFRFDSDFQHYDVRTVKDIQPSGLNFSVVDTGICACINEDMKLELFSNKMGSSALKEISDPIIPGDAVIGTQNGTVIFSHGNKIFSMKTK